ncbi:MAG: hypothetical protein Q8Q49_06125 [bacterium]|nr:hypothetical protein [bacterium]
MHHRPHWPEPPISIEQFETTKFHPYKFEGDGWKSWIKCFSLVTFLLCGHMPSKEEAKTIREYLRRLPNQFKRSMLDRRFALSFISYLFIGFKGHVHESFCNDANSIDALVEFTLSLCSSEKVLFSSFLCAHRDPKLDGKLNLLQSYIPAKKIRRAAALVLALVHNAHENIHGKVIFLQQGISTTATSSVFPEVTIEYLENAQMHVMIERLRYQFWHVSDIISSLHGTRASSRLITLDVLTTRIERFLKHRYGPKWQHMDFTSQAFEKDPIVEIAIHMVLPHIKRMMPFFSGTFQEAVLTRKAEIIQKNQSAAFRVGGKQLAEKVKGAIEWFMRQHSMTISAKAMYETTFFYLWGKYIGKFKNSFAIGFDREHDLFQCFAWKCGLESEKRVDELCQRVPLYARRNPSGREHGVLSDLSFRQFWR